MSSSFTIQTEIQRSRNNQAGGLREKRLDYMRVGGTLESSERVYSIHLILFIVGSLESVNTTLTQAVALLGVHVVR